MLFGLVAHNWWIFLLAIALILATFIWVAGRNAEGGAANRIKSGWSKWRAFSRQAGEVQGRVILTLFYFTVVVPFGLVTRLFADPLSLKRGREADGQAWLRRRTGDLTLDDARRQF